MIEPEKWMPELLTELQAAFGPRLLFVGLQGSYRRGEATETSDIDVVVILDELRLEDLKIYRALVAQRPEGEKSCGFMAGRREFRSWPRHEIFQFVQDTQAYWGRLEDLAPETDRADLVRSVQTGASAIYHGAVHAFIHSPEHLAAAARGLYKSAFFILQARHYLQSGTYVTGKKELAARLDGADREIMTVSLDWDQRQAACAAAPEGYFQKIIAWSADLMQQEF